MRCFTCYYRSPEVEIAKNYYIFYHLINKSNCFFKELFLPDTENVHSKRCDECQMKFKNCRQKKNYSFLVHREQQVGGSTNQQLPQNILGRGVITYYSINYFQHKNFYDFFNAEKIVDNFLSTFKRSFVSNKKVKMQGYIELVNYLPSEIIELESKRVWLTDVFTGRYFNQYINGEMKSNFLKRVIVNGATGSSWQFKRFDRILVIVTDIDQVNSLLSS